jgi:pilus assembly protein Flp/PilA
MYNKDNLRRPILRNPKERRLFAMLFSPKEKGQGLVEYALILVLVAIVVIAALMILGPLIGNVFSKINSSLSGV